MPDTSDLTKALISSNPEKVNEIISENSGDFFTGNQPFYNYIRDLLAAHGKSQAYVFEKAGLEPKYGYRILSQERHSRFRDCLLRICFAGEFTLPETQRVLQLYGYSPLYPRIPRDARIISCLGNGIYDIARVNDILVSASLPPLRTESE